MVNVFASNATDLVIDANGYFEPPATGDYHCITSRRAGCWTRVDQFGTPPFSGQLDVAISAGDCGIPSMQRRTY